MGDRRFGVCEFSFLDVVLHDVPAVYVTRGFNSPLKPLVGHGAPHERLDIVAIHAQNLAAVRNRRRIIPNLQPAGGTIVVAHAALVLVVLLVSELTQRIGVDLGSLLEETPLEEGVGLVFDALRRMQRVRETRPVLGFVFLYCARLRVQDFFVCGTLQV